MGGWGLGCLSLTYEKGREYAMIQYIKDDNSRNINRHVVLLPLVILVSTLVVLVSSCQPSEVSPTGLTSPTSQTGQTSPATPSPTAETRTNSSNPSIPSAAPDSVELQLVAEGFTSPVGLVPSSDDSGRLFVVDQSGTVWILAQGGNKLPEPFVDVRSKMVRLNSVFDERGLLGLAFHPSFSTNGRFFVYYSAPLQDGGPQGWDHTSHVAEYK